MSIRTKARCSCYTKLKSVNLPCDHDSLWIPYRFKFKESETVMKNFYMNESHLWSDGEKLYYSTKYVLNEEGIWETTSWKNSSDANGYHIWTDGTNIYSTWSKNYGDYYLTHCRLDGDTWVREDISFPKGAGKLFPDFSVSYVWTDGTDIYYSYKDDYADYNDIQVIRSDGNRWVGKQWKGVTRFDGSNVWTDGTNIYLSQGKNGHYKLNGDTWEPITWKGFTNFSGSYIWTDGRYIYTSDTKGISYRLNGDIWEKKTFIIQDEDLYGTVWSDGSRIFSTTTNGDSHILAKNTENSEPTYKKNRILYKDHILLDSIQLTSTRYIPTNRLWYKKDKYSILIDFELTENIEDRECCLLGFSDQRSNNILKIYTANGKWNFQIGSNIFTYDSVDTNRHTISINSTRGLTIDDIVIDKGTNYSISAGSSNDSERDYTYYYDILACATTDAEGTVSHSSQMRAKLYKIVISTNDVVAQYLIPAKKTNTSTYGLIDILYPSSSILTQTAGGGSVIGGNPVPEKKYYELLKRNAYRFVDGKWEQISTYSSFKFNISPNILSEYTAELGLTWGDWIDSVNNIRDFYKDGRNVVNGETNLVVVRYEDGTAIPVDYDDVIDPDKVYDYLQEE